MTPTDDDFSRTRSSGGDDGSDGPSNGPLGESDYSTAVNDDPPTTAVRYSVNDGQPVSEAVVFAIAQAEGCSPHELDEPMYNWIDLDALDAVFRLPREEVADDRLLSFRAYGREVTIVDTRDVYVSHPLES